MARSGPRYASGSANGSIRIVHKEYIQDVSASTLFTSAEFPINPGLRSTFPWLSQVTDAYEEYRINAMIFEFKSTSSEFVPTSTTANLGVVMMATNYNATQSPAFSSKQQIENYEGAVSSSPTRSFMFAVETKGKGTPIKTLYIRQGQPGPNQDKRLYDIGNFVIATQGMYTAGTTNAVCGELWVAYDVELFKPKYRALGTVTDHYALRYSSVDSAASNMGTPVQAAPWGVGYQDIGGTGNSPPISATNPQNGRFELGTVITTGSVLNFPRNMCGQAWMIDIHWKAAAGAFDTGNSAPSMTLAPSQMTLVGNWNNNYTGGAYSTATGAAGSATTSGQQFDQKWLVDVPAYNGSAPKAVFTFATDPTAIDLTCDIFIWPVQLEDYIRPSPF